MPGNKPYAIYYAESVTKCDIPALPTSAKKMIKTAIEQRLTTEPVHYGKPLRYSLKGHRRLRVADWRIVYRIDTESHSVYIVAIQHRKHVYDHLD